MASNTYVVEYAKTARSKCKDSKCKETIEKDVLRIGKQFPSPFGDDTSCDWFHAPCIFSALTRARAGTKKIESSADLSGFDDLKSADQTIIENLISGKEGSSSTKKATSGAKKAAPAKKKATKRKAKEEDDDDEDEDDEEEEEVAKPVKKKAAVKKTANGAKGGKKAASKGGKELAGLVFCITGKFTKSRKELADVIEEHGGTTATTVTAKVTHLLASSDESGSAKYAEATKKGVDIISEDEFWDLM